MLITNDSELHRILSREDTILVVLWTRDGMLLDALSNELRWSNRQSRGRVLVPNRDEDKRLGSRDFVSRHSSLIPE